jgi:hypothetical protein
MYSVRMERELSEEIFLSGKDVRCPDSVRDLTIKKEKSYFFSI